jgi:hypothetical protein
MKPDETAILNFSSDLLRYVADMAAMRGFNRADVFSAVGVAFTRIILTDFRPEDINATIDFFASKAKESARILTNRPTGDTP